MPYDTQVQVNFSASPELNSAIRHAIAEANDGHDRQVVAKAGLLEALLWETKTIQRVAKKHKITNPERPLDGRVQVDEPKRKKRKTSL